MSGTKSMTGHLLGAAGAVEAIFSRPVHPGRASCPPPSTSTKLDPDCAGLDIVEGEARKMDLQYVLSNSFGFGGTNATLVFKHPDA